jgi:hypothetical protein
MKMVAKKKVGRVEHKVEIPYLDVSLNAAAAKVKIISPICHVRNLLFHIDFKASLLNLLASYGSNRG